MIQVKLAEGLFFSFLFFIHFLNFQVMLESVKEEEISTLPGSSGWSKN